MLFSSLEFIFIFMPLFFAVYFLLKNKLKNAWILVGSLAFYAYGTIKEPAALVLLVCSAAANYLSAAAMRRYGRRRLFLVLGLIFDFGCLFVFKYLDFLLENVNSLFALIPPLRGADLPLAGLALPIGISFYTFQAASYLIDVYSERIEPERSVVRFATYFCMFPRLTAGPITPYGAVSKRLGTRRHTLARVNSGLMDLALGLGLKVLLANQLGRLWGGVGAIGYESVSTPLAWMGIFAFSMQIYFDFYGYSLMAVGLGRMMGFDLPRNFDMPYAALSMGDFWRRWHISLGAWFRDYIYIPLGGSRGGKAKTVRNLLVVWLITGLWHGASWNFILWGLLTFVLIAAEKLLYGKYLTAKPALGHIYMIIIIPLMWAVFAVTDLHDLLVFFGRLFPFGGNGINVYALDYIKYGKSHGAALIAGLAFCTPFPERLYKKFKGSPVCTILLLAIFWASVYFIYKGLDDPFFYCKF